MTVSSQALVPTAMLPWRLVGASIEWFTTAAPRTFDAWRRLSHELRWRLGAPRFLPGLRFVTKFIVACYFVGKLAAMLAVALVGISLGLVAVIAVWMIVGAVFCAELAIRLAPRVFSLRRHKEAPLASV